MISCSVDMLFSQQKILRQKLRLSKKVMFRYPVHVVRAVSFLTIISCQM